ncbi:ubiquitin-conjugating enzyme E2 W [Coemansia sp. RSA 1933]|nr:ubiquitin-conjugating enzyme E2 W [Coemansia sp. RSA 1933]
MTATRSTKRLMRELHQMTTSSHGSHIQIVCCEQMDLWNVDIVGAEGTLYAGEVFTLRFRFPTEYPLVSPEVVFVGENVPVHPHVYSNGHICLSILYQQWSPALTVEAVCLSILSMLSSCTQKERPEGDAVYVRRAKQSSPKKTPWIFHGKNCPPAPFHGCPSTVFERNGLRD